MPNFLDECRDWLTPLGYSLNISNGTGTWHSFTHDEDSLYPAINCYNENEKYCIVQGGINFKLFLRLESGKLSFGHKDIQRWIDVIHHYELLAGKFPPF